MHQKMPIFIDLLNKIGHTNLNVAITYDPTLQVTRRELLPRKIPMGRSDLAITVFMMKLQAEISYVLDGKLLGNEQRT